MSLQGCRSRSERSPLLFTKFPFLHQCGLTLIEVLVTLVLVSIGLLGLLSMQARAMQQNQTAYIQSQAVSIASEMADRLRLNISAAKNNEYELVLIDEADNFVVDSADNAARKLAKQDIGTWLDRLSAALPSGDGAITRVDDRFTIQVSWDDSRGQIDQNGQRILSQYRLEVEL